MEDFVFAGASTKQFQTLSLKDYPDFGLRVEQQTAGSNFRVLHQFVAQRQLINIDKMLRKGRFQPAHGEEKDKKITYKQWRAGLHVTTKIHKR